jgi:hypothetical protein
MMKLAFQFSRITSDQQRIPKGLVPTCDKWIVLRDKRVGLARVCQRTYHLISDRQSAH